MKVIATNKYVRKLIDKTQSSPTFYKKLNNNLPILDTTIATGCYSVAIQKSNTIEKDRKPALHYQNWICGASGIIFGANRQEKVLKYIDYTGQTMTDLRILIRGIYSNGNETDYKTTEIKPDNQTLGGDWTGMSDSVTGNELRLVKAQMQFIADKLTIG